LWYFIFYMSVPSGYDQSLVIMDAFRYPDGNRLPAGTEDVYHEAAVFSSHVIFKGLIEGIGQPADIVRDPDLGRQFMLLAAERARSVGEFEPAERFAGQSLVLARKAPRPFSNFFVYDATHKLAQVQAQAGQSSRSTATLQAGLKAFENIDPRSPNAPTLSSEERMYHRERRYAGYLTLAAIQGRQGKFAKALHAGRKALSVPVTDIGMGISHAALESLLIPDLEDLRDSRGNSGQGLTPQEEVSLWTSIEVMTTGFGFSHEIPLTPGEREEFSYITDPHHLPDVNQVAAAWAHDRRGELAHRFYLSGLSDERYELYTTEYIEALAQTLITHLDSRPLLDTPLRILEVGAGEARLSGFLGEALQKRDQDVEVNACDANAGKINRVFPIHEMDYREALERFNPHIVLSSWMPSRQDWTPDFRARSDLEGYILVGPADRCGTRATWRSDPSSGFVRHDLTTVNELKTLDHPYLPEIAALGSTTHAFWRE
jgi:hypothetical protein